MLFRSEKAARVMAWTDAHADDLKRASGLSTAGAKPSAGGVYHYSLAWAIGEEPDDDHMKKSALETLEALGLSEHEFFMVAHKDRPHRHVHVAVNLTHPETGRRAELGRDYVTLQKWALDYERQHGVHCQVREDNAAKRGQGKGIKHQNQKQDYATAVTRAFHLSDDGKSFVAALENEGLQLAKSRRGHGFVIVDETGDIQKLGRQLDIEAKDRAKTAAIAAKLEGVERASLPDGDELAKEIKDRLTMAQREAEQLAQETAMLDAADRHAQEVEKKEKAEEAESKRRAFTFQKRREQLDARHSAKMLEVQQRRRIEAEKLEQALDSAFTPRLKQIEQDAQNLQGIVEGKGIRLALQIGRAHV